MLVVENATRYASLMHELPVVSSFENDLNAARFASLVASGSSSLNSSVESDSCVLCESLLDVTVELWLSV